MDFIQHRSLEGTANRSDVASRAVSDRRDGSRHPASGRLQVVWHHQHEMPQIYDVLDVSEHGARIELTCSIPEGMTGVAISLMPANLRIDRPAMVAWCKPVRDDRGILRHYEAGIRFI
ncbi:MAG: hypothetical protein RLZZ558_1206 [Planctomycetota bacterium]|jgi:hypothetical protein